MEALYRYFNGCVAALAALFSPIVPLVWCVVGFISFDFLTGVLASRADARREGEEWYFTSAEAWHTAQKLGFTIIALCMAYLIDTQHLTPKVLKYQHQIHCILVKDQLYFQVI